MIASARIRLGLILLTGVIVLGTVGYMVIEHAAIFDALYMVVITISTVGFEEYIPLGDAGRVLTLALIVAGVGTLFFTVAAILEAAVENLSRRERRMRERRVEAINGHTIICGWGRVGRGVWEIHKEREAPCVVIERDPQSVTDAESAGALVLEGDATHDATLRRAGIERAHGLVAAVNSDSDNLVIVLSAKAIRPDLLVVARAAEAESEPKLLMAGADRVVLPQSVGARRLAALVLHPELADFIDLIVRGGPIEYRVQRVTVGEGCGLAGKSLRDSGVRQKSGAIILAIEDPRTGELRFNPDPEIMLDPGWVLVGVGTPEQLERLTQICTR